MPTSRQKARPVYQIVARQSPQPLQCREYHQRLFEALEKDDNETFELIAQEHQRLQNTIQLVAAENRCSQPVLAALGSVLQNKTAEGFPGDRLHSGCEVIDKIESLAVARAKQVFGAAYANVQPHSGTSANLIVITALLAKGDKILSLPAEQGGHFSHGSDDSVTAKLFEIENYYLDEKTFLLDYESIRQAALKVRPKLIICGASVYSRTIDFARFRQIADEAGAWLLADISHISALVAAGAHLSPVNHAHFTTTSTYKPGGPRGGLILMGKDKDSTANIDGKKIALCDLVDKGTFPGLQGTVYFNNVAAKAVFFKEMLSEKYQAGQFKVIENAKQLADSLKSRGFDVLTGGTDNHMVLVNVASFKPPLTAQIARSCLEQCGIVVDPIALPYDQNAGGLRLGTPIVTKMGMGPEQMDQIAAIIDTVLKEVEPVGHTEFAIDLALVESIKTSVTALCSSFAAF